MKRFLLVLAVFFSTVRFAFADTGTYKILDYKVKLTPHADGTVETEYSQKWQVTSGSIPWMTVGTPNSNFQILPDKNKGAIRSIRQQGGGGWSGVRIDLDKDYRPDQIFEVGFTISQRGLFYADGTSYRLDFTPGWYDRAETGNLRVEMFSFAKVESITSQPKPGRIEGQSLIWEKSNLRPGERFSVSVSFPKSLFPAQPVKEKPRSTVFWPCVLAIVFLVLPVILALRLLSRLLSWMGLRSSTRGGKSAYSGGWIFGGGGSSSKRTGGGGGFGGISSSCVCACACVSCACACACAGGGGAGCDRKLSMVRSGCKTCIRREVCPFFFAPG